MGGATFGFGVIGLGYWGPNLVRNLMANDRADVVAAADLRSDRRDHFLSQYPSIDISDDSTRLITDPDVKAVVITTPVSTHFALAEEALRAGKHVLVAKPLAASVEEAEALATTAKEVGRLVMVDHTFVYTGSVEHLRDAVSTGLLGDLYYFDSVRVNLGLFQHDVNVVWDLAAHDFSILLDVVPERPSAVQAIGVRRAGEGQEDIAYIAVHYSSGFIAHLHVSWLSPVKIRKTLVGGSEKMAVWDDLESDEKVKIYDRGVSLPGAGASKTSENPNDQYRALVDYRIGDVQIPYVDRREALAKEIDHFLDCVEGEATPRSGADQGIEVVRLLEATQRSIEAGGSRVDV